MRLRIVVMMASAPHIQLFYRQQTDSLLEEKATDLYAVVETLS